MTVSGSTAFIYASVLSAVFGIVYLPVLMQQPKAFVSPYAKADVRKRASAAIADALLVASCLMLVQDPGLDPLHRRRRPVSAVSRRALHSWSEHRQVSVRRARDQPCRRPPVQPLAFGSAKLHPARAGAEHRGGGSRERCDSRAIPRDSGSAIRSPTRRW